MGADPRSISSDPPEPDKPDCLARKFGRDRRLPPRVGGYCVVVRFDDISGDGLDEEPAVN